jgi:hypothetical protein
VSDFILSALQGSNADLIVQVASLYLNPGMVVADVTYGTGAFWKQVDTEQYDFRPSDIATGVDLKHLPYGDDEIDVLVLDPPYMYNPKGTVKESLSVGYRLNESLELQLDDLRTTDDVLNLYYQGIKEAYRVIRRGGQLWLKCQDGIESGKQRWQHIRIFNEAEAMGWYGKDLFVLQTLSRPAIRWPHQLHARKNHSYLWILEKK